jgi:hypothetical protein
MKRVKKIVKAAVPLAVIALLAYSSTASAAGSGYLISNFFNGMKSEAKIIVPIGLLLIAAAGIFFAGWGILSAISTKKQQQPLTWQLFAIVGGALAVVVPVIVLGFAGSATDGQGDAESQMSELGIKY